MDAQLGNNLHIREFNEDRDSEVVEQLEKYCETGLRKGVSIYTNMLGDPMCRIRLYSTHIMLVGIYFFVLYQAIYIIEVEDFFFSSNIFFHDFSKCFSHTALETVSLSLKREKASWIWATNMFKISPQVAELLEDRELVGVVRGCIKHVGTGCGETHLKIGCILGLRVSPRHRY